MNPRSRNIKRFYMLLHSGSRYVPQFTYYENDEVTGNITTLLYIGNDTVISVPESIDEHDLNVIGIYTFMNNSNVVSVEIPNTITSID